MQKPAIRFIEILEERHLLSTDVTAELRRQVAESGVNLPPELLARLLVENGHLTKFQASKAISEIGSSTSESKAKSSGQEIGLAPSRHSVDALLEGAGDQPAPDAIVVLDDDPSIDAVQSTPDNRPTKSRSKGESANSTRVTAKAADAASQPCSTGVSSDATSVSQMDSSGVMSAEAPKVVRAKQPKANPWDSFRILGIAVILSLVCIVGFFLIRSMVRGNAEDALKFADNAYQQRSYEDAANAYRNFVASWPTHEKSSYAKVRAVLASFRKDSETSPNPVIGLRTAEELLPSIREESALIDQQPDLAGGLVSLAEKFIARMDATKASEDRKTLMAEMDQLMTLVGDPQYFGSAQRTQLAPTLQRVEESRSRLRREIQRDDELASALVQMDQQLEARQVMEAYEIRSQLINRHPLLEANAELNKRVVSASAIQRDLVQESQLSFRTSADPADEQAARVFVFAPRNGSALSELQGTMIYYLVKGSVIGIAADSGQVQWRRWVGLGLEVQPIRLDESASADLLVVQPEIGRVQRLEGLTGKVRWQSEIGEPVNAPVVWDEDVIVSTRSGTVACLDAQSGHSKWMKQLPQSIDVGPGYSTGGKVLYQPASHSNLYVMDRRDGTCQDVFYLGHREGAVRVAPILLLGQLIVIENINVDSTRIRVLAMSEDGLKQEQPAIPLDGNVVAPPAVDGRQVLVQSNLGNSIVLDIEPSATGEKVTVTARVPRNLDTPQRIWTAFHRNQVWLAESRLARFDLVVTQGKLNRRWIQHEGDEFVGPLQLIDQTLIHVRRQKGNQGLKISAASADSGNSSWETDVGAPVSFLAQAADNRLDVVTSSGSYFGMNEQPIRHQADSNPGEGLSMKRFTSPVWLDTNRAIMLNSANPQEFALYSGESTNRLRILTLPLGSARPTCDPVVAGQRVVVGLDNGNLVMFEPDSGVLVGSPFQAIPMKPGIHVRWNTPAYFPESSWIIAANDSPQIIRVAVGDSLRSLGEETLDFPIVGPLTVLGDRVAAVQSTDRGEVLTLFNQQTLKPTDQISLEGRLIAGPFASPSGALLQTDRAMMAIDSQGKVAWKTPLPSGTLVNSPAFSNSMCLLTTRQGQLWVLNAESGQVQASLDVGQPLATPAMIRGTRVLIGSEDGSVLVLTMPTEHTLAGGL